MGYTINQLDKIIESINYDIQKQTRKEYIQVTMHSSGYSVCVRFMDIDIWTSEDDEREWIEEKDGVPLPAGQEYQEDLEHFIRRRINKEIAGVGEINLALIKAENDSKTE